MTEPTTTEPIRLEGTKEQCQTLLRLISQARGSLHLLPLSAQCAYAELMEEDQRAGYWVEHLKAKGIE